MGCNKHLREDAVQPLEGDLLYNVHLCLDVRLPMCLAASDNRKCIILISDIERETDFIIENKAVC